MLDVTRFKAECFTKGVFAFVLAISDTINSNTWSCTPITIAFEYLDLAKSFLRKQPILYLSIGPKI